MSHRTVKLGEWRSGDRIDGSSPEHGPAGLLPCPFCGSYPVREVHPHEGHIIRFACHAERCAVRPATEYLLEEYAESLHGAWNWRWTPAARTA